MGEYVFGESGTIQGFAGRGVFVPEGLTAEEIMAGAAVLERRFDIAPYISRVIVCDILLAIKQRGSKS